MMRRPLKMGKSQLMPRSTCTACGHMTDLACSISDDGEHKPESGDFTICLLCGHLMVFNEVLELRDPTTDEIIEMAGDDRILQVQRARAKIMRDN